MAGPFSTPVADSVPMDNDKTRTTAITESVQDFINAVCAPDNSQKPVFLANGEVNYIEFFKGPTQTIPNRLYRVDMSYDGILNPTTEAWTLYTITDNAPVDGVTVHRTVTFTHSWTAAEITKTEMVTV